ncbi:helix-turn-helix domain-containing protein [Phyllobacterium sp. SYP-B3895]|uniref:helix-turn-helix domain-containing protein n=1 Tax=Phyllobacterium sp. SYP-B3895 TaxID=2663240 RepID=UPI0015628572|nr:helix-turn-helix domain-containing protein [Phyllobacterium sp. SYP-B3895]
MVSDAGRQRSTAVSKYHISQVCDIVAPMAPTIRDGKIADMLERKLEELAATGMTYRAIARELGTSAGHLWRYRNGEIRSPSYALGTKIVKLHEKVLSK